MPTDAKNNENESTASSRWNVCCQFGVHGALGGIDQMRPRTERPRSPDRIWALTSVALRQHDRLGAQSSKQLDDPGLLSLHQLMHFCLHRRPLALHEPRLAQSLRQLSVGRFFSHQV
jgi:hypothetical protein